ncbi:MAG TPA: Flp family type IVb pilin [Acidimicrobiales bacterium]|nr:Flp family type IVb pilin [Acidimicrobiales bacterium]
MTNLTVAFLTHLQAVGGRISRRFRGGDAGAALVEYALLVALIAAACIAILTVLGVNIGSLFTSVSSNVSKATPAG